MDMHVYGMHLHEHICACMCVDCALFNTNNRIVKPSVHYYTPYRMSEGVAVLSSPQTAGVYVRLTPGHPKNGLGCQEINVLFDTERFHWTIKVQCLVSINVSFYKEHSLTQISVPLGRLYAGRSGYIRLLLFVLLCVSLSL